MFLAVIHVFTRTFAPGCVHYLYVSNLVFFPLPLSPQASGGSGGYVWSCDPDTVGHVTSSGLVTSVAEGMAVVVASDKKNPAHFDKSEVLLLYMRVPLHESHSFLTVCISCESCTYCM